MTIENRQKLFRYSAAVFLIINFLIGHITFLEGMAWNWDNDVYPWIELTGYVLILSALLTNHSIIAVVGCFFESICYFHDFFALGKLLSAVIVAKLDTDFFIVAFPAVIKHFTNAVAWIILSLTCIKVKNSKNLSISASIFALIGQVEILIYNCSILDFSYALKEALKFESFVRFIVFILAAVLLGIGFDTSPNPIPSFLVPASRPANTPETNQIEQLTKLKDLLDSGIITQEEFDEKKGQILGLPHDIPDKSEQ